MKTSLFLFLATSTASLGLSSCSSDSWAKATRSPAPGIRCENRHALAAKDDPANKLVPTHYYFHNRYFMLDAPPPSYDHTLIAAITRRLYHIRTTAYCHAERDHLSYGHLAAVGTPLRFGPVCSAAADWSRYPLGTRFRIKDQPGVVYEVDDYGSALVGSNTIDLYRPTLGSMNDWGVRAVDIDIVKWGSYEDSLRLMRERTQYPHVRRMFLDIQKRLDQAASQPIQITPPTAITAPATAA